MVHEATEKECELIKNRFMRMYPKDKPLSNSEAAMVVIALKTGRQWLRVLKEETAPR